MIPLKLRRIIMPQPKNTFRAPLHPFLFALFPILSLFAFNYDIVPPGDLVPPVLVALLSASLLVLVLSRLVKGSDKAGILATLAIFLFGSYGHFYNLLIGIASRVPFFGRNGTGGLDLAGEPLVIIASALSYVLLSAALFMTVLRKKGDLSRASGVLNIIGIALVLPLIVYISLTVSARPTTPKVRESAVLPSMTTPGRDRPDIYYIILDGYAREDILKEYFHFDNAAFLTGLEQAGFHIADKSRANYNWTFLSLASSLNYSYINYLADSEGLESRKRTVPYELIQNNRVSQFLKSQGYRYVHIDSTWGATQTNPYADVEVDFSKGILKKEFARMWLSTSLLKVFERAQEKHLAARHLYNYGQLKTAHKIPGPKFVFFHSLPPHHPYLFDRFGKIQRKADLNTQFEFDKHLWKDKARYLDQLRFINDKVLDAVRNIIKRSARPPIIVLQSDHGPTLTDVTNEEFLRGRLAILNAIFVPDRAKLIPVSITPVNTFRLIFNEYFSAAFDILEDKSYYSEYQRPYDFREIPVGDQR